VLTSKNYNAMFTFSEQQHEEFRNFLYNLNQTNWGSWDSRQWLHFEGMPGYSINQYEQDNGKTFVVVKFDEVVKLSDERKGKRFKVGGGRRYQPVCDYF